MPQWLQTDPLPKRESLWVYLHEVDSCLHKA